MKKSILKCLLLLIVAASLVMALASCSILSEILPEGVKDKLPDGLFPDEEKPDGEEPDGEEPDGEKPDGEKPVDEIPDLSGITFKDKTVTYDGKYHELKLDSAQLPKGVTATYSTNKYMKAGEYTVTVDFYYKGVKIEGASKSATLTIDKASYDISGVTLPGLTKTYDGRAVTTAAQGRLPSGVSVSYVYKDASGNEVDEMVDAGTYTVWATFDGDGDNYHPITPISAIVEIRRAGVAGLSLADARFDYDGTPKFIYVEGTLPDGATVSYSGNGQTEIGTYTVTASFSLSDNYEPIEDMTATLTIANRVHDMDGVALLGKTVSYTGTSHMIAVSGTLPEGVTVSYTVTDALGNVVTDIVNFGTYTVVASFVVDTGYEPIADMTATVVVNKAIVTGISFADQTFNYDGVEKSIYVVGLPSFVSVTYSGNGKITPGTYTVTATFTADDNVEPISPMSATMTIEIGDYLANPTTTLTYEKVTGGYAVSGITNEPSIIVIPATYEGESVISIKSNAFRGMENIEFVYIPETVKSIGNASFMGCTKLSELYIADFSVTVGADGSIVTVGASALTTIGQKAFAGTAITVVDIPDSLLAIGYGAFEGCNSITKMTIPFVGGSSATSHAYLGYLFGADAAETSYVNVPASLKTVIISDNCKEIPARAFTGLSEIEAIHIGRSVTKIGNNAFAGCTGLTDIYLPASVTTITAAASASASPFYGCNSDLMIVVESASSASGFGAYYAALSDSSAALVIFNKTYEDYVMNKDSYRVADVTDSKAAGIYVGGVIISGFDPAVLTYTVGADINTGYGIVSAIASSSVANVAVTQAAGGVAKVVITSADGLSVTTYTINFTVEGTFDSVATIVGKDGSKGTVSFVIDDGYDPAANFSKSMLAKYPGLSLNFAIPTYKLATFNTADTNGDGIKEPVKDANGKYVYTANTERVDFWRDILVSASGRAEILPHSHDHGFWGMNDMGGTQVTVHSRNYNGYVTDSLLQGGSTMQIWGAQQIVNDLFGDLGSKGITYVTPGIIRCTGAHVINADLTVNFSDSPVWLISDTAVSVDSDGTITLNSATEITLQSVNTTLPAGTKITTNAAITGNIIAAGSVVVVPSGSVVIPSGTNVLGYGDFYDALYDKAYDEGIMIAARNTGAKANSSNGYYTKSYFTSKDNRQLQRSFAIAASASITEETVNTWVSHIDAAVEQGAWVSYCIHNIIPAHSADEGNYILEEHAERLFSHSAGYGDDLWISTYTEATKYYHEWSTATVTGGYNAADGSISVSLTDSERDDIYDMPLTVKVNVPGTWATATVGGESLEIRESSDGTFFVYVNVAPETTVTIVGN